MRILADLIVVAIKLLITLGDGVIFVFQKLLSLKPKKRLKIKKSKKASSIFPTFPIFLKVKYFVIGLLFSFVFIFLPINLIVFLQNLPNPNQLAFGQIQQTTKIYDRHGKLLYQIYANQNRTVVPLSSVPKNLQNATIAIEDKDFYRNPGFDVKALVRAAISNLKGEPLQGGSTITQQLIKSTLLSPERTITRKVKEIFLSFWAERIFSKDKILEMYFNQVPYGGTSWGVEASSQTYFDKDVKDLDLAESAFLAGMPKAPTVLSPFGENPNFWKIRQIEVLRKMRELGYVTSEEEKEATEENLVFIGDRTPIYAPHFVNYVRDLLVKKYGIAMVEKGGLSVTTSLDLSLQNTTQNIVTDEVNKDVNFNLSNGAALITNPKNGDILAMAGSRDYNYENFGNVNVTTSKRQPGSSIKPVTYAGAMSKGLTVATLINDSPITYTYTDGAPSYSPVNYDGRFHGNLTLRQALANSVNIPAVKTLERIGIPTMISFAKAMGITTWNNPEKYGLSLTLGSAEVKMTDMATVYGVFANNGAKVELDPFLSIKDPYGNTIYEKATRPINVIDSGIAFIISDILADNNARSMEFGANSPLNIAGKYVSVKTGTTNNLRDNWTIGYTPNFVVGVWVGNNDNTPMSGIASGITGAAPIWNKIMRSILPQVSEALPKVPDNVIVKNCRGRKEYFIKGTENSVNCTLPSTPKPSPTP